MTPNITSLDNGSSALSNSKNEETMDLKLKEKKSSTYFEQDLKWSNIIAIFFLHVLVVYGFATFPYFYKKTTFIFGWYFTEL